MDTYLYTDCGGRDNNEDFAGYNSKNPERCIWVLADGLGGHLSGEIASKSAVEFILEYFLSIGNFSESSLLEMMEAANKQILCLQNKESNLKDMKTTLVGAVYDGDKLSAFHVGDSRLYYFKNGKPYYITKDHTVSQIAVNMGEITFDQIRFHDDRNKLLKVLGNEEQLKINKLDQPIKVEKGDAILLCSDGFWEYVYETEMEIDLSKSNTAQEWAEFMIKRLLLRVSSENDNFTCISVIF